MSRLSLPIVSLALLLLFTSALAAELPSVSAEYPPPIREDSGPIQFQNNDRVTFRWQSSFPLATVELWQGPGANGYWTMNTLLTNASNATLEYQWSAHVLPGRNRTQPLHLYLYNAENPNCQRCHSNSSDFTVFPRANRDGSGGGGGKGAGNALKYGLGLGLGLGIPLLILLTGLATWICLRRRKQRNAIQDASPTGERLVDWKERPEHPEGGSIGHSPSYVKPRYEAGSNSFAELPHEQSPSEVPGVSVEPGRLELEGDVGEIRSPRRP